MATVRGLTHGVVFWHVSGLRDDGSVGWTSATWEFGVGYRDTPTDTIGRALKDFNGDGFDDAVVARALSSRWGVLLGARSGGRSAPTIIWEFADRYAVGDVNGDGHADLLSSWPNKEGIGWGPGAGFSGHRWRRAGVAGRTRVPVSAHAEGPAGLPLNVSVGFGDAIASADFDGDGYDDFVAMFQFGLALYTGGPEGLSRDPVDLVDVDATPLIFSASGPAMRFARATSIGTVTRTWPSSTRASPRVTMSSRSTTATPRAASARGCGEHREHAPRRVLPCGRRRLHGRRSRTSW